MRVAQFNHPDDFRLRRLWQGMIARCQNDPRYAGRGITVHERWLTYAGFRSDMLSSYVRHVNKYGEDDTTIDRKDNHRGYEPDNCRWATRAEQNQNKRPFVEWERTTN